MNDDAKVSAALMALGGWLEGQNFELKHVCAAMGEFVGQVYGQVATGEVHLQGWIRGHMLVVKVNAEATFNERNRPRAS